MSDVRWIFDLGNSRLKGAALDAGGKRGEVFAITHDRQRPWLTGLRELLAAAAPGDEAWLASVAPDQTTRDLVEFLQAAGLSVRRVQTRARCMGLHIAYAEQARLGVDRFLALLGASARDDGPWLIVSAGSVLTVDLLATDGLHHGGLLLPMPALMRDALADRFAQLDVPEGAAGDFAANTADAIASGAHGAALGLVERSLRKAEQRLGSAPTLVVAGGAAALFAGLEYPRIQVQPSLVLDGLALFARSGDA